MKYAVLLTFQLGPEEQYLHGRISAQLVETGPFVDWVPLEGGRRLKLPENTLLVNSLTDDPTAASKAYRGMLPFFHGLPHQVTSFVVALVPEMGGIDAFGNWGRAAINTPVQPQRVPAHLGATAGQEADEPVWRIALSDAPFPW